MQPFDYRALRIAAAAALAPLDPEVRNLARAAACTSSPALLARLVRAAASAAGCGSALARAALEPLCEDLAAAGAALARPPKNAGFSGVDGATLRACHSLLLAAAPLARLPVAKAVFLDAGLAALLATLLHHALAAWNRAQDAGDAAACGDCATVCRLTLTALKALVNTSVRP